MSKHLNPTTPMPVCQPTATRSTKVDHILCASHQEGDAPKAENKTETQSPAKCCVPTLKFHTGHLTGPTLGAVHRSWARLEGLEGRSNSVLALLALHGLLHWLLYKALLGDDRLNGLRSFVCELVLGDLVLGLIVAFLVGRDLEEVSR